MDHVLPALSAALFDLLAEHGVCSMSNNKLCSSGDSCGGTGLAQALLGADILRREPYFFQLSVTDL